MEESRVLLGFDMETDIGSWTPWYRGFQPGTEKILAVLEKHDVKATFFFTADAARKNVCRENEQRCAVAAAEPAGAAGDRPDHPGDEVGPLCEPD